MYHLFKVGGQIIYPIYDASGGIVASSCAILIEKLPINGDMCFGRPGERSILVERDGGRWVFVQFPAWDSFEHNRDRALHAILVLAAAGTMKEVTHA
jgi:hypothetical protein